MATRDASNLDPALLGILALLAADRSERDPEPSIATELVLDAAGLSHQQIASILGKKPDAIRMKISRAKSKEQKK